MECSIDENGWDGSPTILGAKIVMMVSFNRLSNGFRKFVMDWMTILCDNGIDEEDLVPKTTWYYDGDDDGYGTSAFGL